MKVSGRAVLAAGVAALTGGALAFTPSVLPSSMRTIEVLPPVTFTADSTALPVSDAEVRAALDLIGDVSTAPGHGKITIRLGTDEGSHALAAALPAANVADEIHRAPAVARTTADPDEPGDPASDVATLEEPGDDPAVLNAASDIINDVYAVTRYWANYVSLELGPWLINWVPFGYLISDQIYIWYPDFVLPVVDSFVYDFLDPVVNNPLDLGVWVTGIGDIINTAVTGVYNGIVSEIQYVLDFGWFPIPLPPLPDFPLPFAADSTEAAVTLAASEADPATEAAADTQAAEATQATETTDAAGATEDTGAPADPEAPAGEVAEPEAPVEGDAEQTGEVTGEVDDTGVVADDAREPAGDTEVPVEAPVVDGSDETVPDVDESTGEESDETVDEIVDEAVEDSDAPAGETEHADSGDTGGEVTTDATDTDTDSTSAGAGTGSASGDTGSGE